MKTMRAPRALAWCGTLLLLLWSGAADARPLFSSPSKPGSFADAFKVIYDFDIESGERVGEKEAIPPYLAETQCGGSNKEESVAGKIATVTGMPGHLGIADADPYKGMARRFGTGTLFTYIFPDTVQGLSTACGPYQASATEKLVWRFNDQGELVQMTKSFQNPSFQDPVCRWHSKGGPIVPQALDEGAILLSAEQWEQPNTPGLCDLNEAEDGPLQGFRSWSNEYTYLDCKVPGPPGRDGKRRSCLQWCERYTCTDSWKEDTCRVVEFPNPCVESCGNNVCDAGEDWTKCSNDCPPPEGQDPVNVPAGPKPAECFPNYNLLPKAPEASPNSVPCAGDECRCPLPTGGACLLQTKPTIDYAFATNPNVSKDGWLIQLELPNNANPAGGGKNYESYYRQYEGAYSRDAVPDVPTDQSRNVAQVGCYGFYDEFDPANRQTLRPDRRCTMNIDVSYYKDTQEGKTTYATVLPDIDPVEDGNQRAAGSYDEENDPWFQRLGLAYSLLNPKTFQEKYDGSLTNLLLDRDAMDLADLAPPPQTRGEDLANGSFMRSFDDSGTDRTVAFWWQKQQAEAAALFHPTTVRLILPLHLAQNMAQSDPLFADIPEVQRALRDPQSQTIELQLFARRDLLGEVFAYIERSLLPVEEEPVHVVLPMASPVELRALAQAWCAWYMRVNKLRTCDDADGRTGEIIDRLYEYASDIDEYRAIRTSLYDYASTLLETQADINRPLVEWMEENEARYEAILSQQERVRDELLPKWNEAQGLMTKFGDVTNAPWCMNHRFTTPVYSLLDEWLPARAEDGRKLEQGEDPENRLPSIDEALRPKDIILDLTNVRFMTGSLKIPVLRPIQVRMELPVVPGDDGAIEVPDAPPQLPDVSAILDAMGEMSANLPEVNTDNVTDFDSPIPDPYPEESIDRIRDNLDKIVDSLNQMNERYGKFWESIGPLKPFEDWTDEDREFAFDKQRLACEDWDDEHCQHVEMDLYERLQRIGSRPGILLQEDYRARGFPAMEPRVCLFEDGPCTILNPVTTGPVIEWEYFMEENEEQEDALDRLRSSLRDATMREPVGGLSSSAAPRYDTTWDKLPPGMDVSPPLDIAP